MRQPAQCWMWKEIREGRVGKLMMKRNEQVLSNTVTNHSNITNIKIIITAMENPKVSVCLTQVITLPSTSLINFVHLTALWITHFPNLQPKFKMEQWCVANIFLVYNPSKTREETWHKFTILSLHVPSFNFCTYLGMILSLEGTLTGFQHTNTNFAFVYTKEERMSLDWFLSEPYQ
jgi:hypothetical protein